MDTVVAVDGGKLRGELAENGLAVFRGVPFARAARFAPPEPVEPWAGIADATSHGQISPQPPPRIGAVMGEPTDGLAQGEDCLNLTVVTPGADGKRRPVMVWVHGGAYVTGASSFGFYDGQRFAAEGEVVFVGINYRLGALGYLRLPGVSPGNLGLLDQMAALRWVKENIAAFGGDPDQVTVFGQSAGAHSIACLMAIPAARGLFQRAILQSAPLGLKLASTVTATRIGRLFTGALRTDPMTAGVGEILAAQQAAIAKAAGPGGLNSSPQFCPVADTDPLPSVEQWRSGAAEAAVDVLIGATKAEMNAFLNGKPGVTQVERIPWLGRRSTAAVKAVATRQVFERPSRRFADDVVAAGGRVFTYRFDWAAPGSAFGACHCVELPFLLGDRESWAGAPMLAGAEWDAIDEIGRGLRAEWLSFARDGSVSWPPHSPVSKVAGALLPTLGG